MVDISRGSVVKFVTGTGVVEQFSGKHKALVRIEDDVILAMGGATALLKTEHFAYRGALVNQDDDNLVHIRQLVEVGTQVRFHAHPLDSEDGDAQWFIMYSWLVDEESELALEYIPALSNRDCRLAELDPTGKRMGVLTHHPIQGGEIDINFSGSKVWQYGKKLSTNQSLKDQMQMHESYYCDAVPHLSLDKLTISWKAVNVWKGVRQVASDRAELSAASGDIKYLVQAVTSAALNSKALYVRGQAQVLKIINEELGLALLHIGFNVFESVLFSRAGLFALGFSMKDQRLQDVLKEGDPLQVICTSANQGNATGAHAFKWIACSVHLDLEDNSE